MIRISMNYPSTTIYKKEIFKKKIFSTSKFDFSKQESNNKIKALYVKNL